VAIIPAGNRSENRAAADLFFSRIGHKIISRAGVQSFKYFGVVAFKSGDGVGSGGALI